MTDLRSPKLRAWHHDRAAVVYVRQSTPQQVLDHRESTAWQYALSERAIALGWTRDRVVTIDDDLGKSGQSIEGRPVVIRGGIDVMVLNGMSLHVHRDGSFVGLHDRRTDAVLHSSAGRPLGNSMTTVRYLQRSLLARLRSMLRGQPLSSFPHRNLGTEMGLVGHRTSYLPQSVP